MRRLILVFACRILVYCGNCCSPDNLLYCTLPLFVFDVAGVAHSITLRFHVRGHLCLLFIRSWRSRDGETFMLIHDKDYFVLVLIYYTKLVFGGKIFNIFE